MRGDSNGPGLEETIWLERLSPCHGIIRSALYIYEFAGTQESGGEIVVLSNDLSEDAVVYVHTEQFQILGKDCWEKPGLDHAHRTTEA